MGAPAQRVRTLFVVLDYLLIVAALLAAHELGYLGGLKRFHYTEDQRDHLSTVMGALLATMGFVLAFSFSIVEARFAGRRAMVLQEANAIGTAYLRADFLPTDPKNRTKQLLIQYLKLRMDIQPDRLNSLIAESERVQRELWSVAVEVGLQTPGSETFALYLESLNDVIALHRSRVAAALRNRLPPIFLYILYGSSFLALVVLGVNAGQSKSRNLVAAIPLVLLIAALLHLVADMNRSDLHLMKVGQGALEDVLRTLNAAPPPAPGP